MRQDTPTYLTFDIDSLDPVFAPGTGTPECGGLTSREAQHLLRGLVRLFYGSRVASQNLQAGGCIDRQPCVSVGMFLLIIV